MQIKFDHANNKNVLKYYISNMIFYFLRFIFNDSLSISFSILFLIFLNY